LLPIGKGTVRRAHNCCEHGLFVSGWINCEGRIMRIVAARCGLELPIIEEYTSVQGFLAASFIASGVLRSIASISFWPTTLTKGIYLPFAEICART
jgi:hypothetical protein